MIHNCLTSNPIFFLSWHLQLGPQGHHMLENSTTKFITSPPHSQIDLFSNISLVFQGRSPVHSGLLFLSLIQSIITSCQFYFLHIPIYKFSSPLGLLTVQIITRTAPYILSMPPKWLLFNYLVFPPHCSQNNMFCLK